MKRFLLIVLFCIGSTANADDMSKASKRICDKVKSCGLAELERQQLPPEMAAMMKGMFEGMCQAMVTPYIIKAEDKGLEKKSLACLDSIEDMSCGELMEGDAEHTPACKDLQKAVDEAYPDGIDN